MKFHYGPIKFRGGLGTCFMSVCDLWKYFSVTNLFFFQNFNLIKWIPLFFLYFTKDLPLEKLEPLKKLENVCFLQLWWNIFSGTLEKIDLFRMENFCPHCHHCLCHGLAAFYDHKQNEFQIWICGGSFGKSWFQIYCLWRWIIQCIIGGILSI